MSLKRWLKEDYKQVIFITIYSLILIYIVLITNIILMDIIAGIMVICCIILFVILEYQIRKDVKKKKNYKQGL